MQSVLERTQVWTFEDLYSLPEADPRAYEIVDGALVVSPAPGIDHDYAGEGLRRVLAEQCPAQLYVAGPVNLDLHPSYRIPDLCVIPRSLLGQRRILIRPQEVPLVIEVVSPSSVTTDRVTKPAQYAAAGIGAYWRVEFDPEISLTAYELRSGADAYTEVGTWRGGEVAELERPFPVRIELDDLTPTSK